MTSELLESHIAWQPEPFPAGVRVVRSGGRVVVDWTGFGRLVAPGDGREPEFFPSADADLEGLGKFRATSLLACKRYLRGGMSLHASAVALRSGALVLLGDSGAGKSTLATALVERGGSAFLADDVVPIDWDGEIPLVHPVEDSFWLDGAAVSGLGLGEATAAKRAYPPRERSRSAQPLRAIVELAFDESATEAKIEPLAGLEAFLALSRAQITLPVLESDVVRDLAARAHAAGRTRLYRLRRRRSFADLGAVTSSLERLVCGEPAQ